MPHALFHFSANLSACRFEAQLTAVKERLEAVKAGSKGMQPPLFSFAGASSRIAKPLRGGGGDASVVNGVPVALSGTQGSSAQQETQQGKRTSWFFNPK